MHELLVPTPVPSLAGVRVSSVAAAEYHSLVLTEAGATLSFGSGDLGRLGHGDEATQRLPKVIEALRGTRVTAVAAGSMHSLVLTEARDVYSFGYGAAGRLGHGATDQNELRPRRVAAGPACGSHRWAGVSAGRAHSLVLSDLGSPRSIQISRP